MTDAAAGARTPAADRQPQPGAAVRPTGRWPPRPASSPGTRMPRPASRRAPSFTRSGATARALRPRGLHAHPTRAADRAGRPQLLGRHLRRRRRPLLRDRRLRRHDLAGQGPAVARDRSTTMRTDAECPSLSPDGTRWPTRSAATAARGDWRLAVLDLATGKETQLAETRSVDDQVEWLDDDRILYGLPGEGTRPPSPTSGWSTPTAPANPRSSSRRPGHPPSSADGAGPAAHQPGRGVAARVTLGATISRSTRGPGRTMSSDCRQRSGRAAGLQRG